MLRFIGKGRNWTDTGSRVSIHLMLRFIHAKAVIGPLGKFVSIHLMLRFILINYNVHIANRRVSIHLMLRFINIGVRHSGQKSSFNTSHVTVYLCICQFLLWPMLGFNTSHVTVYRKASRKERGIQQFQYISCYGLSEIRSKYIRKTHVSIHLMLRFIYSGNVWKPEQNGFQYISCYGLSLI